MLLSFTLLPCWSVSEVERALRQPPFHFGTRPPAKELALRLAAGPAEHDDGLRAELDQGDEAEVAGDARQAARLSDEILQSKWKQNLQVEFAKCRSQGLSSIAKV